MMFLKKKRHYHEPTHGGVIGIKETIWDSAIGMKSGLEASKKTSQASRE